MISRAYAGVVVAMIVVAGCKVGPDYTRPETAVPATWSSMGPTTAPTTRPTTQPVTVTRWWTTFGDATLNGLVDAAAESNLDLKFAAARVREARALARGVRSDLLPDVNAGASYQRSRRSEGVGFGGVSRSAFPGVSIKSEEQDLWTAGFDAQWELDVFGGVKRSIEAADASLAAAEENRRDVLTILLAEVARNYIELRGLQQQLQIALGNLKTQQDTVELANTRFQAGLTGELDVIRAKALAATTAAAIPLIQSLIDQAIHRLSVLVAREPGALKNELAKAAAIPPTPPAVPVGLPSDLLRRRSDIRRAERELAAATAFIGVATADLFPRFSLTGNVGLQSDTLRSLGNWDSRFWSAGPSVSWPIFDRRRIRANIEVQNARQEQALAVYESTVLTALREVEDALVAYAQDQLRRQSLAEAVAANRRAVELSNELYTRGLVDFLSVLEAQRSLFITEEQLVLSERAVAADLVALYKALGGGWEVEEEK